jgi:hypothetical protein
VPAARYRTDVSAGCRFTSIPGSLSGYLDWVAHLLKLQGNVFLPHPALPIQKMGEELGRRDACYAAGMPG